MLEKTFPVMPDDPQFLPVRAQSQRALTLGT